MIKLQDVMRAHVTMSQRLRPHHSSYDESASISVCNPPHNSLSVAAGSLDIYCLLPTRFRHELLCGKIVNFKPLMVSIELLNGRQHLTGCNSDSHLMKEALTMLFKHYCGSDV